MPYALVIVGLLMIVTGINNTYSQFGAQLQADMTGSNNQGRGFIVWVIALFLVGALGYINNLRTFSHYFMALILISMILANKGVFAQFQKALNSGPVAPTASPEPSAPSSGSTVPKTGNSTLDNAAAGIANGPGDTIDGRIESWIGGKIKGLFSN